MRQLLEALSRCARAEPRSLAALWFLGFGFIAAAVVFIAPAAMTGGVRVMATYSSLLLPAVSAGFIGYVYGVSILDNRRTRNHLQALLRGLLVAFLSLVVDALLLVLSYSVLELGRIPHLYALIGMFSVALIGGLVTTLPVILIVGGTAAILLFKLGRYAARQMGSEVPGRELV